MFSNTFSNINSFTLFTTHFAINFIQIGYKQKQELAYLVKTLFLHSTLDNDLPVHI